MKEPRDTLENQDSSQKESRKFFKEWGLSLIFFIAIPFLMFTLLVIGVDITGNSDTSEYMSIAYYSPVLGAIIAFLKIADDTGAKNKGSQVVGVLFFLIVIEICIPLLTLFLYFSFGIE